MWRNHKWFELCHSAHLGHPYHTGEQVEVYPTQNETATSKDEANKLANDLINLQIRSTPVTIDPSGPGSPLYPRGIELRTPTRSQSITDAHNSNVMSTQTMAAMMETIARTLAGERDEDPPLDTSSNFQDPQQIRDTFDIALR